MEHSDNRILLDSGGQRFDSRIARALTRLLPRLRRHFPQLREEFALTEILERAGDRIAARERQAGPIEKLHGYAWVTIRTIATSAMRRNSARLMAKTLESEVSRARLASVPAVFGTAEEVERNILLREVLERLSHEERLVCLWKKAGFSSQEIAKHLGRSVTAVDVLFLRAKQKLRNALGTGANHRRMVAHADGQLPEVTNARQARYRDGRWHSEVSPLTMKTSDPEMTSTRSSAGRIRTRTASAAYPARR